MSRVDYDYIVIGAGIEGSATAYQLTKRGHSVLLLEQFSLPHTRGSSHGATRITRRLYSEAIYTQMMQNAFKEWSDLERQERQQLYVKTGTLLVSDPDNIKAHMKVCEQFHCPIEQMNNAELSRKYKGLLHFDEPFQALMDKDGGLLKADKCLIAFWNQIQKNGGHIHDEERLVEVIPGDQIQRVRTDKSSYTCKAVVMCLGAWAGPMLKNLGLHLPLRPEHIKVCYWESKSPESFSYENFPTLLIYSDSQHFYGLSAPEKHGLYKFCYHNGPDITPDRRNVPNSEWCVEAARRVVAKNIPGLKPEPVITESCIYTWTPDTNFILDKHPHFENVVIGAGFSGHGFKMSIEVGNILADLATKKRSKYDLSKFSIKRFNQTQSRL